MIRLIILLLAGILNIFCSCEKVKVDDSIIQVYKFKEGKDYSNNVPVELSLDKSKITSNSSCLSSIWPMKLDSGYFLNGSMGVNSGYLSLTREEYNAYDIMPGVHSLYKLLIEADPYLEYYEFSDDGTFSSENGAFGIDTLKINDLIRTQKLENYFERLK